MNETDRRYPQYDEVSLSYTENTAKLGDFEELVDELAQDFASVRVSRHIPGPMASPLFGDIATELMFGALAVPFLAELSKDAYRLFRKGLVRLYGRVTTETNLRSYHPVALVVTPEGFGSMGVVFVLPKGLNEREIEDALTSIDSVLAGLVPQVRPLGFEYRPQEGWSPMETWGA